MDEGQTQDNARPDTSQHVKSSHAKSSALHVIVLRRVVNWIFLISAILYCLFHVGFVIWNTAHNNQRLLDVVFNHYAAIVGLPFAGYAALAVVLLLEARSGEPIEFTAPGFSFKGASGPIVLWVVCFLAVSICLKLLW
jgi:hypothetical protein